jgi:hypothetical protein
VKSPVGWNARTPHVIVVQCSVSIFGCQHFGRQHFWALSFFGPEKYNSLAPNLYDEDGACRWDEQGACRWDAQGACRWDAQRNTRRNVWRERVAGACGGSVWHERETGIDGVHGKSQDPASLGQSHRIRLCKVFEPRSS